MISTKKLVTALFFSLASAANALNDYSLDRDTAGDCTKRVGECRTSDETFLECPQTCANHLDGGLMVQGYVPEKDAFYNLEAKSSKGDVVDFERFDGYVTVIAALPLMPGMAQYYYELMEYFSKKFPYMVSTAVLPFKQTNNRNYDIHNLDIFTKNKSLILETHTDSSLGSHPVVEFVESVERNQRGRDPLFDDRAIIFVVSHNGRYVERRVCPTKEKLELVIEHYLEIQEVKMS